MHAGKCAPEFLVGRSDLEDLNVGQMALLRRISMKQRVDSSGSASVKQRAPVNTIMEILVPLKEDKLLTS
jgi:hypothetical protein